MFAALLKYFIDNGELYLEGVGNLRMHRQAARLLPEMGQLAPPHTLVRVEAEIGQMPEGMLAFLRTVDAGMDGYRAFCGQLVRQLQDHQPVYWPGLGTFLPVGEGMPEFRPDAEISTYQQPISIPASLTDSSLAAAGQDPVAAPQALDTELVAPAREAGKWWVGAAILAGIAIALIIAKKMGYL